jgi:uncharacterized protein
VEEAQVRRSTVAVLRSSGARFAFVFGSRSSSMATARPDSDFDVAAWWADRPPGVWDVPVPAGVDLLILNNAPLELAGAIALHGEPLFDDAPVQRVRWVALTRRIWLDERPRYQRAHAEFLEAVRGRRGARAAAAASGD